MDDRAARYYEDALSRYEKRDLKGAVIQLKNALQIDRSMLPVQVLLGRALLADGDVVGAEVAFSEALRLGVSRAEVVVPLARAVLAQGKPQQLLEQARFAVAGLPRPVQGRLLLMHAAAYADLGDPRSAMRIIAEAKSLDSGNAEAWLAEVPVRIRLRQWSEAQTAVERALALAPDDAEAWYLKGTVQHSRGDAKGALEAYATALRLQPADTEALVSRAGLLIDVRRLPEAARDVAELQRTSPNDPRGYYLGALVADMQGNPSAAKVLLNRITAMIDPVPIDQLRYRPQALMLGGLAHFGLEQREKAKPYLEMAQRQQPNTGLSKLLAQIYLAEKSYERAVDALEAYLKAFPMDSQALVLLAAAHMAQGRHARATQLMQGALKEQQDDSLRTMLGMSLVASGRFADASAALESAYRRDPRQVKAGMAVTTLYLQSGQIEKAHQLATLLVQQQPANAGVQYLFGSVQQRRGDLVAARRAYESALRVDPNLSAAAVQLATLDAQQRAYAEASQRLTAVLGQDARNVAALSELARLAERQGSLEDAQRWWEKAEDASAPGHFQAGLDLVDFQLRHNRAVAAAEVGKRLIGKAPESPQVLLAVSRAQLAMGDAVAARGNLTKAATLAGYNPPLLLQVALLQLPARDLDGAAYTLAKALAERPGYLPAQALLAEVEIRQRDFTKAEARIRQILAAHPKLGVGYGLEGDLAMFQGRSGAAIDSYRKAHQLEQSSASLLRLFSALGDVQQNSAHHLAAQWLQGHPLDLPVRRALADSHARAGNLKAARTEYEALLKGSPGDAEVLNNLANVLLLEGDPAALEIANQALSREPSRAHIIGTAGLAAYRSGQTDRALQLLRDARLRDPNNPETRYFLATVLAGTERKAEAKVELEAALGAGQPFSSAKAARELLGTLK